MHRRQHHSVLAPSNGELRPQPDLERRRVGVQSGEVSHGGEIVALRRTVHPGSRPIERADRSGESDPVDQLVDESTRRHPGPSERLETLHRVGELLHLRGVLVAGESSGETTEPFDVALFGDPVPNPGVESTRRSAERFADVDRIERRSGREAQPRERRTDSGALEELEADTTGDRHTRRCERHLDGGERRIDPGQHGDLGGCDTFGERPDDHITSASHRVGIDQRHQPTRPGRRCPHRLRDPTPIVPEQAVDGIHHIGRAAVVHLERMITGRREPRDEVDQPGRVRTVVPVDRLIIVAHPEHRPGGCGQQAHEEQVSRREILELVDEQHTTRPLGGPAGLGLREQDPDRSMDLSVEVDHPVAIQRTQVLRVHVDQPVDVTAVAHLGGCRIDQAEPYEPEGVDPGSDRVDVQLAGGLDEAPEDSTDVGLVHGSPLRRLRCERADTVDDRQGDRVEGSDLQPHQIGGAATHLLLGALVERHEGDRRRRKPPRADEVPRPLGEHPGLARTRRCDDPCGATGVRDGGELIRSEFGTGDVRAGHGEVPVFDRDDVHDTDPADRIDVTERPTVEPHRGSVGKLHVAVTVDSSSETDCCIDGGPAWRLRITEVDRVGPDQMVQFVREELVSDTDLVRLAAVGFIDRITGLEIGTDEFDHDRGSRPSGGPERVEG